LYDRLEQASSSSENKTEEELMTIKDIAGEQGFSNILRQQAPIIFLLRFIGPRSRAVSVEKLPFFASEFNLSMATD
jgi:hypothetical protein